MDVAVIVGVGPGLGWALVQRFAREGMTVAAVARSERKLLELEQSDTTGRVRHYAGDVSQEDEVAKLFQAVFTDLGIPQLVVFNAGTFEPGEVLDTSPATFERCWRIGCFGGFLVARAAAGAMLERGSGTIIFTGATASLRGSAGFANLAVPKFGLRALAQSMARELGPKGIHVAHVVIDGQIESERYRHLLEERGPDSLLQAGAIAETYFQLHQQPRSSWTQELDLRPWSEKF
jgi:NAD(P)-dependent dehydrogenase (short-subunit alcohol dehydrogenase family)